jgi:3-deoxy-D-manno-octulosonic acid (KDO) 8-phosphate synthase
MGFLKKLFGGSGRQQQYHDKDGIYFHTRCQNCGSVVRNRISRQHDLNQSGGSYVWHKTIVDSRCFQPMLAVVRFDASFNVVNADISGGQHISESEYQQALQDAARAKAAAAETAEEPASSAVESDDGNAG